MDYILEMRNITKVFPGVKALDEVNIKVKNGEIHALCGENGAGKSTLMKVLSGVYPHDSYDGEIHFKGEICNFKGIKDSEKKGIVIIHQELALIPELTIAENIFLGNEIKRRGIIDWDETHRQAKKLMEKVKLQESSSTLICDIGVGKQQLVEIAKAMAKSVQLLILDEPTSSLNEEDSQNLLKLIVELKNHGVTSIIISHKLNEIEQIADSITILRDGKSIETLDMKVDEVHEDRIIKSMVGREMNQLYPTRMSKIGDVNFEIKNWSVDHPQYPKQVVDNVSIKVRKGEVVGIAGLIGAGRTELAMSVFGKSYGRNIKGELILNGKPVHFKSVSDAVDAGLAYVTEDRKQYGLNLIDSIMKNITLTKMEKILTRGILDQNKEIKVTSKFKDSMNIKCSSLAQTTGTLSGGNQQKVVLSKWMFTEPEVLILDEPTRGIDVGAKYEIYTIINRLAEEGKSVLFISSELQEVISMSDRIYVMNEGVIMGELQKSMCTQENIMKLIVSKEHKEAYNERHHETH